MLKKKKRTCFQPSRCSYSIAGPAATGMTTVGKNSSKGWQGSPCPSHLEWQSEDMGEALFSSALGRKMLIGLCVCVCVCVCV